MRSKEAAEVLTESALRVKPWWCGLLGGAGPETFGFSLLHLFSIIQEKGVSGYHIPIMQN